MKKIYVIADSFGTPADWVKPREHENTHFWARDLQTKLPDYEVIINAKGSRDIQTIIDTWVRTLKYAKPDDYFIICLPYFRRTRLPFDQESYIHDRHGEYDITTRFVGTPSYDDRFEVLEFWGKQYHWKYFEEKLQVQEIINTTKANQLNTIEIIEALVEFTKIKTYIFSWDVMDIKSKYIEDKEILTQNIGFWETHFDVFVESGGKFGLEGDLHWSHKMQKHFGEYVFEKFFYNKTII